MTKIVYVDDGKDVCVFGDIDANEDKFLHIKLRERISENVVNTSFIIVRKDRIVKIEGEDPYLEDLMLES